MTKIKKIFRDAAEDLSALVDRFPISLLILLGICILGSISIESFKDPYLNIFVSASPTLLISIVFYLYCENESANKMKGHLLGILSIIIGVAIYLLLPSNLSDGENFWLIILFVCLNLILILSISLVGFLRQESGFVPFNSTLFFNFWGSLLISLLVFVSLAMLQYSLEELFKIKLSKEIYGHISLWSFLFIGVGKFISDIPKLSYESSNFDYGKLTSVIVTNVGIPVAIIYGLIAYAYVFKSLINGESTIVWINPFILWFIGIGYVMFLLNKNIKEGKKINRFYDKGWLYFILPIGIFFIINLFVNIKRDGIDEEYYFLILAGVLLVSTTIYLLFINTSNFRIINIMAIGLLSFAILPTPYNAWNSTSMAQKERLLEYLMSNQCIVDNTLVVPSAPLEYDKSINSIIYRLSYKRQLSYLSPYDTDYLLKDSISAREFIDLIRMGSPYISENKEYITKYYPRRIISTNGYDYIIPITTDIEGDDASKFLLLDGKAYLDIDNQRLHIPITETDIMQDTMIKHIGAYDLKLLIYDVSLRKEDNRILIEYMDGLCLLRDM